MCLNNYCIYKYLGKFFKQLRYIVEISPIHYIMIATYYQGNHNFSVEEVSPNLPQKGEVQIKVAYCGVCGTDVHIYHGMMDKRVKMPLTIGHEMSGTIHKIGDDVTGFEPGEKVVWLLLGRQIVTRPYGK